MKQQTNSAYRDAPFTGCLGTSWDTSKSVAQCGFRSSQYWNTWIAKWFQPKAMRVPQPLAAPSQHRKEEHGG